jgi:abhydrolase domain-containing protein 1/3
MKYKPSLFTLNAQLQIVCFVFLSIWEKFKKEVKYTRKIFTLSDGGELALDWLVHSTNPENQKPRPLVVCVPGLSGDSSELYCIAVAKSCLKRNLDMVVVNYRGTAGIPLRVSFLSCS